MSNTLRIFSAMDFSETGNVFRDDAVTDNDQVWFDGTAATGSPANKGYYLFPTRTTRTAATCAPATRRRIHLDEHREVRGPTNQYGFFGNLKAAAMILNKTDAIIAARNLAASTPTKPRAAPAVSTPICFAVSVGPCMPCGSTS